MATAYLVIICDMETNEILKTEIWSSPEWRQTFCRREAVYIAYQLENQTKNFGEVRAIMLKMLQDVPVMKKRYGRLLKYCNDPDLMTPLESWEFQQKLEKRQEELRKERESHVDD